MAAVLFVDTNFFLQVKEPASLPWTDILSNPELILMVPRTIQAELDRLKQDGNSRRSKRARKASSFLRHLVQSPDHVLVVRDAHPRVLIAFPPINGPSRRRPSSLDRMWSDDEIVGEVLDFMALRPSDQVFLLTSDTGPMLTARYHSVPFIAVPEKWLLEPEPDERDRTIQELRHRLDSLERLHPKVEIIALVQERKVDGIEAPVSVFEPLQEAVIEQLMAEVHSRCPMANEFGISGTELAFQRMVALARGRHVQYTRPTADEIRKYRDDDYPAWVVQVRQKMAEAASRLNQRTHFFNVCFQIVNNGTVPANNARLEMRAHGKVSIQAPQNDRDSQGPVALTLPMPPSPPRGHIGETRSALSALDVLDRRYGEALASPFRQVAPERDRNAFYWDVKSVKPVKLLSLTCDEFRHRNEAEDFRIAVVLPPGTASSGAISCRLSASNLPEPVQLTVPSGR